MGHSRTIDGFVTPSLFGELAPLSEPPPKPRGPVVFKDPDPRGLSHGGGSLEAHLRRFEETEVFAIRDFLRAQDWSSFAARYSPQGRHPYAVPSMLGLILLGVMRGQLGLRDLERLARLDLEAMWLSGGLCPDHSTFGEFLLRHQEDLEGGLFERLTAALLRLSGGQARDVSADGTVLQAAASAYRRLTLEAAREQAACERDSAQSAPHDEAKQQQAAQSEQIAAVAQERAEARAAKGRDAKAGLVCPHEPDAVLQPLKSGAVAPSYKASVLANDQRLIVGASVHPSSETAVLPEMLDQAQRIGGAPVERLKCDAGYHSAGVGALAVERELDLLCPEGKALGDGDWEKRGGKGKFPKSAFRYDEDRNQYTCPAGAAMTPQGHDGEAVLYTTTACQGCALRARCTEAKSGRTIKRLPGDEVKEAMRQVMRHPEARRRYRKRQAEVEPVFSYLRAAQGVRRLRRRGLVKVRLEVLLHATAYNVRRGLRLAAALGVDLAAALTVFLALRTLGNAIGTLRMRSGASNAPPARKLPMPGARLGAANFPRLARAAG